MVPEDVTGSDVASNVVADTGGPVYEKRALNKSGYALLAHEAAMLRAASHPGVVELLEADDGRICTRLAGTSSWADRAPTTMDDLAGATAVLADTLADLHDLGLTHGRLDATHVIVGEGKRPVLCGFSAATDSASPADRAADVAALKLLVVTLAASLADATDRSRFRAAVSGAPDARTIARLGSDSAAGATPTARTSRHDRLGRSARRWTHVFILHGWVFALGLALLALHTVGASRLPAPPLGGWNRFNTWIDTTNPAIITLTLLRILAMGIAYYLLVGTGIALLDGVRGRKPIRRLLPHRLEQISRAAVAAGVIGTLVAPLVTDKRPRVDTSIDATQTSVDDVGEIRAPTAALTPSPSSAPLMPEVHEVTSLRPEPVAAQTIETTPTWTVAPGDHLWAIAAETIEDAWDRPPGSPEVAEYWLTLIEHNRSRLADPTNPDLIVPGQIIELPGVGNDPAT